MTTWNEIPGQETAKRVCEIAAAGGHRLLIVGPPGTGRESLAEHVDEYCASVGIGRSCRCGYFGSSSRDCTCESVSGRIILEKFRGIDEYQIGPDRITGHDGRSFAAATVSGRGYLIARTDLVGERELGRSPKYRERFEEHVRTRIDRARGLRSMRDNDDPRYPWLPRAVASLTTKHSPSGYILEAVKERCGWGDTDIELCVRVARTIADLTGRTERLGKWDVSVSDVAEAVQYLARFPNVS